MGNAVRTLKNEGRSGGSHQPFPDRHAGRRQPVREMRHKELVAAFQPLIASLYLRYPGRLATEVARQKPVAVGVPRL